jgi:hypothetical protein
VCYFPATQCSPTDLRAIKRNFANVQVCIRDTDPPEDCIILPIVDDTCLNLDGGLDRYNDVLSWAEVPNGYICEFFEYATRSGVVAILIVGPGTLTAAPITTLFRYKPATGTCSMCREFLGPRISTI